MSIAARLVTADELFRMPEDSWRYELIEGELRRMTPAGSEHGFLSVEIAYRLAEYVRKSGAGCVFGAETGFRLGINPDTVLAPDASFIRQTRVDAVGIPEGFFPEAPALAVEIVSRHDVVSEVDSKAKQWLKFGAELVWVIHPAGRTITVYKSSQEIRLLASGDMLDGEAVLPGFTCKVADLFAGLDK
jgi:Uma2 family endonuclease